MVSGRLAAGTSLGSSARAWTPWLEAGRELSWELPNTCGEACAVNAPARSAIECRQALPAHPWTWSTAAHSTECSWRVACRSPRRPLPVSLATQQQQCRGLVHHADDGRNSNVLANAPHSQSHDGDNAYLTPALKDLSALAQAWRKHARTVRGTGSNNFHASTHTAITTTTSEGPVAASNAATSKAAEERSPDCDLPVSLVERTCTLLDQRLGSVVFAATVASRTLLPPRGDWGPSRFVARAGVPRTDAAVTAAAVQRHAALDDLADIITNVASCLRSAASSGRSPPPDLARSLVSAATAAAHTTSWPQAASILQGMVRMRVLGKRLLDRFLARAQRIPLDTADGHDVQRASYIKGARPGGVVGVGRKRPSTTAATAAAAAASHGAEDAVPSAMDAVSLLRTLAALHALPAITTAANLGGAMQRLMQHLQLRLHDLPGPAPLLGLLRDVTSCGWRHDREPAFLRDVADYLCSRPTAAEHGAAPATAAADLAVGPQQTEPVGRFRDEAAGPGHAAARDASDDEGALLARPPRLLALSPAHVVEVLDLYARAGVYHSGLMERGLDAVERCLPVLTPSQAARMAEVCARFVHHRPALMRRLALHVAAHLRLHPAVPDTVAPGDVAAVVAALARCRVRDERFMDAVAVYAAEHGAARLKEAEALGQELRARVCLGHSNATGAESVAEKHVDGAVDAQPRAEAAKERVAFGQADLLAARLTGSGELLVSPPEATEQRVRGSDLRAWPAVSEELPPVGLPLVGDPGCDWDRADKCSLQATIATEGAITAEGARAGGRSEGVQPRSNGASQEPLEGTLTVAGDNMALSLRAGTPLLRGNPSAEHAAAAPGVDPFAGLGQRAEVGSRTSTRPVQNVQYGQQPVPAGDTPASDMLEGDTRPETGASLEGGGADDVALLEALLTPAPAAAEPQPTLSSSELATFRRHDATHRSDMDDSTPLAAVAPALPSWLGPPAAAGSGGAAVEPLNSQTRTSVPEALDPLTSLGNWGAAGGAARTAAAAGATVKGHTGRAGRGSQQRTAAEDAGVPPSVAASSPHSPGAAGDASSRRVSLERLSTHSTALVMRRLSPTLQPRALLDELLAVPGSSIDLYYMPYDYAAVSRGRPGLGCAFVGVTATEGVAALARRLQEGPMCGGAELAVLEYLPPSNSDALLRALLNPNSGYSPPRTDTTSRPVLLYVSGALRGKVQPLDPRDVELYDLRRVASATNVTGHHDAFHLPLLPQLKQLQQQQQQASAAQPSVLVSAAEMETRQAAFPGHPEPASQAVGAPGSANGHVHVTGAESSVEPPSSLPRPLPAQPQPREGPPLIDSHRCPTLWSANAGKRPPADLDPPRARANGVPFCDASQLALMAHSLAVLSYHPPAMLGTLGRLMQRLIEPAVRDPRLITCLLPAPDTAEQPSASDTGPSPPPTSTAAAAGSTYNHDAASSPTLPPGQQDCASPAAQPHFPLPPLKSVLHALHALSSMPSPDAEVCHELADVCASALLAWVPQGSCEDALASSQAPTAAAVATSLPSSPPPSPPGGGAVSTSAVGGGGPNSLTVQEIVSLGSGGGASAAASTAAAVASAALPPRDVLDVHVRLLAQVLTAAADHGSLLYHPRLCDAAAALLRHRLRCLRVRAACALLQPLVRLRHPPARQLVAAVAPLLAQDCSRLSASSLVDLAWVCARTGLHEAASVGPGPGVVVAALANRTRQLLHQLPTPGLVQVFWALAALGHDGRVSAAAGRSAAATGGGGGPGGRDLYWQLLQVLLHRYDMGARDLLLLQEGMELWRRQQQQRERRQQHLQAKRGVAAAGPTAAGPMMESFLRELLYRAGIAQAAAPAVPPPPEGGTAEPQGRGAPQADVRAEAVDPAALELWSSLCSAAPVTATWAAPSPAGPQGGLPGTPGNATPLPPSTVCTAGLGLLLSPPPLPAGRKEEEAEKVGSSGVATAGTDVSWGSHELSTACVTHGSLPPAPSLLLGSGETGTASPSIWAVTIQLDDASRLAEEVDTGTRAQLDSHRASWSDWRDALPPPPASLPSSSLSSPPQIAWTPSGEADPADGQQSSISCRCNHGTSCTRSEGAGSSSRQGISRSSTGSDSCRLAGCSFREGRAGPAAGDGGGTSDADASADALAVGGLLQQILIARRGLALEEAGGVLMRLGVPDSVVAGASARARAMSSTAS